MIASLDTLILPIRTIRLPATTSDSAAFDPRMKKSVGLDRDAIAIAETKGSANKQYFLVHASGEYGAVNAVINVRTELKGETVLEPHYFHVTYEPLDFRTYERYAAFAESNPIVLPDLPEVDYLSEVA